MEKLKKGHIPWRFVTHVVLLLVVIIDAFLPTRYSTPLFSGHERAITSTLLPPDLVAPMNREHTCDIASGEEAVSAIEQILTQFWQWNAHSLANYVPYNSTLYWATAHNSGVAPLTRDKPLAIFEEFSESEMLEWLRSFQMLFIKVCLSPPFLTSSLTLFVQLEFAWADSSVDLQLWQWIVSFSFIPSPCCR